MRTHRHADVEIPSELSATVVYSTRVCYHTGVYSVYTSVGSSYARIPREYFYCRYTYMLQLKPEIRQNRFQLVKTRITKIFCNEVYVLRTANQAPGYNLSLLAAATKARSGQGFVRCTCKNSLLV